METRETASGSRVLAISYDNLNRPSVVMDSWGNELRIERSEDRIEILSPDGHHTILSLDQFGYISSITAPDLATYDVTHDETGLLTVLKEPSGLLAQYSYDSYGRLVERQASDGSKKVLSRSETQSGRSVSIATGMGVEKRHFVERVGTNGSRRRVVMPSPAGVSPIGRKKIGPN